jgi:hypothetical protein
MSASSQPAAQHGPVAVVWRPGAVGTAAHVGIKQWWDKVARMHDTSPRGDDASAPYAPPDRRGGFRGNPLMLVPVLIVVAVVVVLLVVLAIR